MYFKNTHYYKYFGTGKLTSQVLDCICITFGPFPYTPSAYLTKKKIQGVAISTCKLWLALSTCKKWLALSNCKLWLGLSTYKSWY